MAVAFTHLSWWLWSGKHQEPRVSNGSSLISPPDAELREPDTSKLPMTNGKNMASASRRVKKKAPGFKERRVVREYDVVIVPSDGGCFSGSESDDSDWSIGWLEPHGPGFGSDNESDDSFAVLVPCYGRGRRDMKGSAKDKLNIVAEVPDTYAAENKYMERWLSSLRTADMKSSPFHIICPNPAARLCGRIVYFK